MFVRTHIVQKGDTLWKIAKQYGIDFEELKRLNSHLANPDYIVPGMEIILPNDHLTQKHSYGHKEMPDKAKTIETPPKDKKVEIPPKAKPIETPPKKQPVEKEMKLPEIPPTPPVPQIVPMTIQQMHPHEKTEFHFDFAPHLNIQRHMQHPQIMPIPQPVMPQPIFIKIPQPEGMKEETEKEKEKVVEKEYVPVPQTHIEYVPVPQPIFIPCMPQHPCNCKPHKVERCGCREAQDHMQHHAQPYFTNQHMLPPCPEYPMPYGMDYQQMMPYGMDYSQGMPYSGQPAPDMQYSFPYEAGMYDGSEAENPMMTQMATEYQTTQNDDTDWLFESTSQDEQKEGEKTLSQDYSSQMQEGHQDYNVFEQATMPSYDYYQMPQGYHPMNQGMYPPMFQSMPQAMYPQMNQGFDPSMQQYYPPRMNPCAPHFKPWSY